MAKEKPKEIRNIWGHVAAVLLLVGGVVWANDVPVAGDMLEAEIVGVHRSPSENPQQVELLIRLETGQTIKLAANEDALNQIGATVKVRKYERKLLKTISYRIY